MLTSTHRPLTSEDASLLEGKGLRIALVQARFHVAITTALRQSCQERLLALGVQANDIQIVTVPGALEVPLAIQALAEKDCWDALVAIGCVIRGETFHFELVAQTCTQALSRLALDYQIPILNAVLTTEDLPQAQARCIVKGQEAADGAVEMANWLLTH
jgi:6,7-dimethyl-8-ribityllumazine synthase